MDSAVSIRLPFPIQPSSKMSRAMPLLAMNSIGQPVWNDRNADSFIKEGYVKNWVLFTAVHDIASSAAAIRLQAWSTKQNKFLPDHPVSELLRRPNPLMTDIEFYEAAYAYRAITGNCFLEWSSLSESGEGSKPEELYVLPPNYMKVIPGRIFLQGYLFDFNGQQRRWDYDLMKHQCAVMHWKSFNPTSPWYGLSAVQAAAMCVDTHNKASEWNKALLDNAARPSGALVYSPKNPEADDTLTTEQYDILKSRIEDNWSGVSNRGRPILLEGGLQWQQMSLTPIDMDFLESKNTDAIGIAKALGYPPFLLGLETGSATFSNVSEARLSLYQETILPMVDSLKKKLTNWLQPYFGDDFTIEYDADEIPALQGLRDKTWERVEKSTFLTVNEKREACRYEPIEGGDVVLVSGLSMALGEVGGGATGGNRVSDDAKGLLIEAKDLPADYSFKDSDRTELLKQVRLQNRLTATHEKFIAGLIERSAKEIAKAYKSGGTSSAVKAAKATAGEWQPILTTLYKNVCLVSGQRVLEAFKSAGEPHEEKAEQSQSEFEEAVLAWIKERAVSQSVILSGATVDRVREILLASVGEGLGTIEIGKRLYEALGDEVGRARANAIARTEVHQAFNTAAHAAAESTGVKLVKKWLATPDERTRDTHKVVDRENGLVKLNKPFQVGKSRLMFPGDPEGEAGEVINCRCGVRHLPA